MNPRSRPLLALSPSILIVIITMKTAVASNVWRIAVAAIVLRIAGIVVASIVLRIAVRVLARLWIVVIT